MDDKNNKNIQLRQAIGLPHATAMVVGTIIGASIFVQPSEITGQINSISGVFLVWLVSGILTFFGALVCAELASIFTQTGGIYVYLKEAFSPAIGFLWGWSFFWSVISAGIAAIAVIFARYLSYFFPMNAVLIKTPTHPTDSSIGCVANGKEGFSHRLSRVSGCSRSRCPTRVSTSSPSTRICTFSTSLKFMVSVFTIE